jgi:hypothetical protein
MKYAWVVALAVVVACSGKKDGDKAKKPAEPAPREEDPHCAEKIPDFAEWMKALVADGRVVVTATGVELPELPGAAPGQITRGAPVVVVKPTEVVVEGKVLANPSSPSPADLAKQMVPLVEPRPGTDVVFVIDAKVPWSTVAALLAAAPVAKHPRVTLVFAAGSTPAASPPPKSAIDAELDALAHPDPAKPAPSLGGGASGPGGDLAMKVFADCAAVTQKLFPAIDKVGPSEFDVAVAVGMPEEIQLCGCRVDLPSVRRLMWAWWGRDQGPALAGTRVEVAAVAKDGTLVTTKPETPWSEAAPLVAAAAEQGKPITLK